MKHYIAATPNHVGVCDNLTIRNALHHSGRKVRGTFQSVTGFRFTGLNRKEVESGNAKAIQAISDMGPIPEQIMERTLRPSFSPNGLVIANTDTGYFSQPTKIKN